MSADDQAGPAHAAREPLTDDDHDLLTFNEAGERLRVEVSAAAARVVQLESDGASDELDKARDRLEVLRSAAERNSAQPINDANFEKFFGYPGTPRRNLAARPEG
jgi:hypothetical protein